MKTNIEMCKNTVIKEITIKYHIQGVLPKYLDKVIPIILSAIDSGDKKFTFYIHRNEPIGPTRKGANNFREDDAEGITYIVKEKQKTNYEIAICNEYVQLVMNKDPYLPIRSQAALAELITKKILSEIASACIGRISIKLHSFCYLKEHVNVDDVFAHECFNFTNENTKSKGMIFSHEIFENGPHTFSIKKTFDTGEYKGQNVSRGLFEIRVKARNSFDYESHALKISTEEVVGIVHDVIGMYCSFLSEKVLTMQMGDSPICNDDIIII